MNKKRKGCQKQLTIALEEKLRCKNEAIPRCFMEWSKAVL